MMDDDLKHPQQHNKIHDFSGKSRGSACAQKGLFNDFRSDSEC